MNDTQQPGLGGLHFDADEVGSASASDAVVTSLPSDLMEAKARDLSAQAAHDPALDFATREKLNAARDRIRVESEYQRDRDLASDPND